MSWHRTDDQAGTHPKIGRLTDREARALVFGLWLYTSRTGSPRFSLDELPQMTFNTPDGPRAPSRRELERWQQLELVDTTPDGSYLVHDWHIYNGAQGGTGAIAAAVRDNPAASANEIHRMVGGNRKHVLREVKHLRAVPTPEPVPRTTQGTDQQPVSGTTTVPAPPAGNQPEPVTHVRPLPYPEEPLHTATATATEARTPRAVADAVAVVDQDEHQREAARLAELDARRQQQAAAEVERQAEREPAAELVAERGYDQAAAVARHVDEHPALDTVAAAARAIIDAAADRSAWLPEPEA